MNGPQIQTAAPEGAIRVLVDGRETRELAVEDRGLQYGDGVFETILVEQAQPRLWERHVTRLLGGCRRLEIPAPSPALLRAEANGVCRGVTRGVLKIVVTRGSGGRGYRPSRAPVPTRILSLYPPPDSVSTMGEEGIAVRVCETRLGLNPRLAGIKHLNRLEQVLARNEWQDVDIPEGLMLDVCERVVEGTMTNLFIVRGGVLFTPSLQQAGVAGIMRQLIIELASAAGVQVVVTHLDLAAVHGADEVFVCNSVVGLWPVRALQGSEWSCGPLTRRLSRSAEAAMRQAS